MRLVLRQHDDLEVAGVDDVGQREVDQPVDAAERDRGFGPVGGQRHQPLALPAGEHDRRGPSCGRGVPAMRPNTSRPAARAGRPSCGASRFTSCASTSSARSTRRRSTAAPASTSPSSSAPCAPAPTSTPGCAASVRRATRPAPRRTPNPPRSRPPTRRIRTLGVDLAMVGRLRRRGPRPLAHLVRQHGRPPRRAAARRPARRQRALPGADAAVEGRAARRRLRRLQLGRDDGVRRGAAGSSPSAAAMRDDVLRSYPDVDPDQGARGPQRHRHRALVAAPEPRPGPRAGRRPGPPERDLRRPDHPAEGAAALPARRRRSCRPTSSWCCAPAPRTPPRSRRRCAAWSTALAATRDGVVWIAEMLPRADVVALLTAATVFACPSIYEPLGIVNLEAMACETAVVATATGGIPEVVVHGETGWLVPIEQATDGTGTPLRPRAVRRRPRRRAQRRRQRPRPGPGVRRRRPGARPGVLRLGRDRGDGRVEFYRSLTRRARADQADRRRPRYRLPADELAQRGYGGRSLSLANGRTAIGRDGYRVSWHLGCWSRHLAAHRRDSAGFECRAALRATGSESLEDAVLPSAPR